VRDNLRAASRRRFPLTSPLAQFVSRSRIGIRRGRRGRHRHAGALSGCTSRFAGSRASARGTSGSYAGGSWQPTAWRCTHGPVSRASPSTSSAWSG
jgi:hypothetical protein